MNAPQGGLPAFTRASARSGGAPRLPGTQRSKLPEAIPNNLTWIPLFWVIAAPIILVMAGGEGISRGEPSRILLATIVASIIYPLTAGGFFIRWRAKRRDPAYRPRLSLVTYSVLTALLSVPLTLAVLSKLTDALIGAWYPGLLEFSTLFLAPILLFVGIIHQGAPTRLGAWVSALIAGVSYSVLVVGLTLTIDGLPADGIFPAALWLLWLVGPLALVAALSSLALPATFVHLRRRRDAEATP